MNQRSAIIATPVPGRDPGRCASQHPRRPHHERQHDDENDIGSWRHGQDGHAGQLYELTGPRLLTFAEAVEEIGKATGRDVRFPPVSMEQFGSRMAKLEVPPEFVSLLTYLFTEVLDGRNARPADGVQRALGRGPRDFIDYARDAAAAGAWGEVRAWRRESAAPASSGQS
jgi:hypothetical protein